MKVTIGKRKVRKKTRWVVSYRENGKRKRVFFKSKEAANDAATSKRDQIGKYGAAWFDMNARDRQSLISIIGEAKTHGIDLQRLINDAKHRKQAKAAPTLKATIDELIKAKEEAGRAEVYTESLRQTVEAFAEGRGSMPINEIEFTDVETFLKNNSDASRQTLRSRLSTLFKFAVKHGYRPDNPCDRLETLTITKPPPSIFTADQFKAALEFLNQPDTSTRTVNCGPGKRRGAVTYQMTTIADRKRILPWFILSTCCGLRPQEADKTPGDAVNLDEGWITVEAQTSKIRQRRVVYPLKEAVGLLRWALERGKLPVDYSCRRRAIRALRDHLGFKAWPRDITRHTAATYWLAVCENAPVVALALGHSVDTMRKHYLALATRDEAARFWAVAASFPVDHASLPQETHRS